MTTLPGCVRFLFSCLHKWFSPYVLHSLVLRGVRKRAHLLTAVKDMLGSPRSPWVTAERQPNEFICAQLEFFPFSACFRGVKTYVISWASSRVDVVSGCTGFSPSFFALEASWNGSWSTWGLDRRLFVSVKWRIEFNSVCLFVAYCCCLDGTFWPFVLSFICLLFAATLRSVVNSKVVPCWFLPWGRSVKLLNTFCPVNFKREGYESEHLIYSRFLTGKLKR